MNEYDTKNYMRISSVLMNFKILRNLKGHAYLCDAIAIALEDFNAVYNLSNNIYAVLAKKYDTSPGAIYSSVRYAIQKSWTLIDTNKKNKYYVKMMGAKNAAPSNSVFINHISYQLMSHINRQ